MCGACGAVRADWAASVLATSYARTVVARVVPAVVPRVTARAGSHGWTLGGWGMPMRVCAGAEELLDALGAMLRRHGPLAVDGADRGKGPRASAAEDDPRAMGAPRLATGDPLETAEWIREAVFASVPHRPLTLDRGAVPVSRIAEAPAAAVPLRADRIIHGVLASALVHRACAGTGERGAVLADARGPWLLLTH